MKNLEGLNRDYITLSEYEWIVYGRVDSRTWRSLRSDSVQGLMGEVRRQGIEINELEPGLRLVVINQSLRERMSALIKERVLPIYLDILAYELPTLREAFESTHPFRIQGYRWKDLNQWIICGLLMDWGVGRLLYGVDQGVTCEIWCIQGKGETQNKFGLRRRRHALLGLSLWEFWHHRIQKLPMVIDAHGLEMLYHIWSRGGVLSTSDTTTVRGQKALLLLTYHGLITKDRRAYSACLPIFTNEDYANLCHEINRISLYLTTQAITPIFSEVLKNLTLQDKALLRIFNRFVMEQVTDEVIQQGLLSPFPTMPPPSWGCWVWIEGKHKG